MDCVVEYYESPGCSHLVLTACFFIFDGLYDWQMEALHFAPRLKNVLSRVLPVLGSVKDSQRKTFADGNIWVCNGLWMRSYDFY